MENGVAPGIIFVCMALWNLMLVLTACCLVLFLSPQASASGIPEVKAILNGINVPKFLSFKTFVAKFLGQIESLSYMMPKLMACYIMPTSCLHHACVVIEVPSFA